MIYQKIRLNKENLVIQLLFCKVARKTTGFKSLRVNCQEINQVTAKYQIDYLEKPCKTKTKNFKTTI